MYLYSTKNTSKFVFLPTKPLGNHNYLSADRNYLTHSLKYLVTDKSGRYGGFQIKMFWHILKATINILGWEIWILYFYLQVHIFYFCRKHITRHLNYLPVIYRCSYIKLSFILPHSYRYLYLLFWTPIFITHVKPLPAPVFDMQTFKISLYVNSITSPISLTISIPHFVNMIFVKRTKFYLIYPCIIRLLSSHNLPF